MITLLLNIINVMVLVFVLYRNIKLKIDTSIIWYCLVSLYFINIPLFFDCVQLQFQRTDIFELNIIKTNPSWIKGTLSNMSRITIDSLLFNLILILTYSVIVGKSKRLKIHWTPALLTGYLSWKWLIILSWLAFILFLFYNQISLYSFTLIQTGQWYQNRLNIPLLGLIVNLLIPICSISSLKMLVDKKWILGIIALFPLIIIGAITGSRSQIISIIFFVLYYFLIKLKRINILSICFYTFILLSTSMLLQSYRGNIKSYPVAKDSSYSDLFYSYEIVDQLRMNGESTKRLIATGFIHNDKSYRDITIELGKFKYRNSYVSLHPTILGWAYLDLKNLFFIIAIHIGFVLGITDKLRYRSPLVINEFMLSFVFTFIAVGVRGSLQFAYSTLIYPLFIMILLWLNNKYHFIRLKRSHR